jgi:hypothetical protein
MNFKLKYYKTGQFKRPLVKIKLQNIDPKKGEKLEYLALIDSGADLCVFHADIAPLLGISLTNIKPHKMSGVSGKSFNTYLQVIKIGIKDYYFEVPVYFSKEISKNGYGFLGQQGFFDYFKQIRFEYNNGNIILKK